MEGYKERSFTALLPTWFGSRMLWQQNCSFSWQTRFQGAVRLCLYRASLPGRARNLPDRHYGLIYSQTLLRDEEGEAEFTLPSLKAGEEPLTLIVQFAVDESYFHSDEALLELHDELSRPVADEALLLRQALRAGKGLDCLNEYGRCPILAAELTEGPRAELEIFVDIVVGDIWIAAGQSQMALPYSAIVKQRRIYSDSLQRVRAYHDGRWVDAERTNALQQVSAAGLRAATLLAERLSYPIGLIDISLPGSGLENYLPPDIAVEYRENRNTFPILPVEADISPAKLQYTARTGPQGQPARTVLPTDWTNGASPRRLPKRQLWTERLEPLRGMGCRGIFWWQGENDVNTPEAYIAYLPRLLEAWRGHLRAPEGEEIGFIYAQLPPIPLSFDSPWLVPRFNIALARALPSLGKVAGLIAVNDLSPEYHPNLRGWEHPLHPLDKFTVGERFAYTALGLCYSRRELGSAPQIHGWRRIGKQVMLDFKPLIEPLRLADGSSELRGFWLADRDGIMRPAQAKLLHGVNVLVYHHEIAEPLYCAYSVAGSGDEGNLCTRDHHAVVPFVIALIPEEADTASQKDLPPPSFIAEDSGWVSKDRTERFGWFRSLPPGSNLPEPDLSLIPPEIPRYADMVQLWDIVHPQQVELALVSDKVLSGQMAWRLKYAVGEGRSKDVPLALMRPNPQYDFPRPPTDLRCYKYMQLTVFNPDRTEKGLALSPDADKSAPVVQQFSWQKVILPLTPEYGLGADGSFTLTIRDPQGAGPLYIDSFELMVNE